MSYTPWPTSSMGYCLMIHEPLSRHDTSYECFALPITSLIRDEQCCSNPVAQARASPDSVQWSRSARKAPTPYDVSKHRKWKPMTRAAQQLALQMQRLQRQTHLNRRALQSLYVSLLSHRPQRAGTHDLQLARPTHACALLLRFRPDHRCHHKRAYASWTSKLLPYARARQLAKNTVHTLCEKSMDSRRSGFTKRKDPNSVATSPQIWTLRFSSCKPSRFPTLVAALAGSRSASCPSPTLTTPLGASLVHLQLTST